MKVLIGSHGFIGSNLAKGRKFDLHINSKNLSELDGLKIDELVIAAPSRDCLDERSYNSLKYALLTAEINKVILISTTNVYNHPVRISESSTPFNRDPALVLKIELEKFVLSNFTNSLVLRLPTVFGLGCNNTILFNLLSEENLHDVNINSVFQWYNVKNLNNDMTYFSTMGLDIVNLVVEPVETKIIINEFFPDQLKRCSIKDRDEHDVWSIHPGKLLNTFKYFSDRHHVMRELEKFIKSV